MSVGGATPCRRRGPFTTIAGIDIDDVVRKATVTDINAKQRSSILTDVIVVRMGVEVIGRILIRPSAW